MKIVMNVIALMFMVSQLNFASAQVASGSIPACNDDDMVVPCVLSEKDAGFLVSDMLLENTAAYQLIAKQAQNGFTMEELRVTFMSDTNVESQVKYELLLNDCRGTDACNGMYVWTVIATTKSDGYTYQTIFKDTLVNGNQLPELK